METDQFMSCNQIELTKFAELILASQAQPTPSQSEPVAQAYINCDGECEQIDWLGTINPKVDDEFTPLYAKPQPTSQEADAERWSYFIETCSSEAGFELTGINDASNEQINAAIDAAMKDYKQ